MHDSASCPSCGRTTRPVFAVDIDGTLADYHSRFIWFAADWMGVGTNVSSSEVEHWLKYDGSVRMAEWMGISDELYRQVKLAFRQGGMKRSLTPYPHAKTLMNALSLAGVEVWITTTRPYLRLDNVDPDTRHWLDRCDLMYDRLIYDADKYKMLLEQVGTHRIVGVYEDLRDNCLRAEELGLQVWQHHTRWNAGARYQWGFTDLDAAAKLAVSNIEDWKRNG